MHQCFAPQHCKEYWFNKSSSVNDKTNIKPEINTEITEGDQNNLRVNSNETFIPG